MYVIQAEGGPVKVGITIDPQKRLLALRTGTPFPLRLAHVEAIDGTLRAASVERAVHDLLSAAHAHGEWFNVSVDEAQAAVQQAIRDLQKERAPVTGAPMSPSPIRLTPRLVGAARALLDWSQDRLAEASHLGLSTIRDFEKGIRVPSHNNLAAVVRAFEDAGVQFIPENGGGAGVRMRQPAISASSE